MPWRRMAKTVVCPCSVFSPADPKILSEDTNKMSNSQQIIDTIHKLHTKLLLFCLKHFRSANKIDEDDALVHLVLPSTLAT